MGIGSKTREFKKELKVASDHTCFTILYYPITTKKAAENNVNSSTLACQPIHHFYLDMVRKIGYLKIRDSTVLLTNRISER